MFSTISLFLTYSLGTCTFASTNTAMYGVKPLSVHQSCSARMRYGRVETVGWAGEQPWAGRAGARGGRGGGAGGVGGRGGGGGGVMGRVVTAEAGGGGEAAVGVRGE